MADLQEQLGALKSKFEQIEVVKNPEQLRENVANLTKEASDPALWDDAENAQMVNSRLSRAKAELSALESVKTSLDDITTMLELAEEAPEYLSEAEVALEKLTMTLDELEISTLMTGEFDKYEAVVTIRAGAGGVEAMDWAGMLLRMYERWAAAHSYSFTLMDASYGEEAGVKSATFEIREEYAYGELQMESGTHRLVRMSPFNAQGKRQTSFAAVEVIPLLPETTSIDIPESEIKTEVFRASGPGGQCVNTTDSAVRLTHIPTGTVVSMQNEKSQIQNRATALRVLQSRLLLLKRAEEAAQKKELAGTITAAWGDQIRNYVLAPFQLVKDTRTGEETAQSSAVLDGKIDDFIKAGIRYRANLTVA